MAARSQSATADVAESLIRETGSRMTMARVQILKILLNAGHALTHNEVEDRLGRNHPIDRVTVYRVLDWLTESGLAHKITDADRVWRFNAARDRHGGEHAHFTCTCCAHTICLEGGPAAKAPRLPDGYQSHQVEVVVRGLCEECSRTNHKPSAHKRARKHRNT
ncbi:MAG TPA: Fur family transcriptional regulator [Burkholderiales bacterium]|nr:Fur family transcriptional regulator [Burkholderiales bacterium]